MSPGGIDSERPLSALPSVQARVLAFFAILIAGTAGALIGYSFVKLQCHGDCAVPEGIAAIVGGVGAAAGVAVVAVLVLRAMGEWSTIKAERAAEIEAREAAGSNGGGGNGTGDGDGDGGNGDGRRG